MQKMVSGLQMKGENRGRKRSQSLIKKKRPRERYGRIVRGGRPQSVRRNRSGKKSTVRGHKRGGGGGMETGT